MRTDLFHAIALAQTPLIGPVTARSLVSYAGSLEAVFSASEKQLLKMPSIGPKIAEAVRSGVGLRAAERELSLMEANGIEAVHFLEEAYPARLKSMSDAPVVLFFKGSQLRLLDHSRIVGIVGTRRASRYGQQMTEALVEGLGRLNCLIVSGLAFGIDVAAHQAAIKHGLPTLAAMGNGLGRIYPSEHRSVAEQMAENGGLLTEYAFGIGPDREHFPQRNRIVAGLSDALIIVETDRKGGSMITASFASEYGRDVFAVPGRANDASSAGCNHLIRRQAASICESADDVAVAMRWEIGSSAARGKQAVLPLDLPENERILLETVKNRPEIGIDDLLLALGWLSGEAAAIILNLEFKGLLRTLPGKRYVVL